MSKRKPRPYKSTGQPVGRPPMSEQELIASVPPAFWRIANELERTEGQPQPFTARNETEALRLRFRWYNFIRRLRANHRRDGDESIAAKYTHTRTSSVRVYKDGRLEIGKWHDELKWLEEPYTARDKDEELKYWDPRTLRDEERRKYKTGREVENKLRDKPLEDLFLSDRTERATAPQQEETEEEVDFFKLFKKEPTK